MADAGFLTDHRLTERDDDRTADESALEAADAVIEQLRAENADLRQQLEALTSGVERVVEGMGLRRSECQLFDCEGCQDCGKDATP